MSDKVICQDMDAGNVPGTFANEMPATDLDNEMPETDLNNEIPVSTDDIENSERHVVNGDSYASRAARTAAYEYPPRQERARYSENVMPQRPRTAFFMPNKNTSAKSVFEALEQAEIDPAEITCLQRKMNGEVTVTFKSISAKEQFLRLNSLQVDAEHFALQDVDKPLTFSDDLRRSFRTFRPRNHQASLAILRSPSLSSGQAFAGPEYL